MSIKKGFTLIELLVVIGIMAVLAAGVVALIDPVDKSNQANDARMQNLVGEIATAEASYAAQHQGCFAPSWAALNTAGELTQTAPVVPANYAAPVFTNGAACVGGAAGDVVSANVTVVLRSKKYTGNTIWKYESTTGRVCNVAAIGTACP